MMRVVQIFLKNIFKIKTFIILVTVCLASEFSNAQSDISKLTSFWEMETENISTDSAIIYYSKILKVSEKAKSSSEIVFEINARLGELYRLKADFASALKFDLQSLRITEKNNNSILVGRANNNIGTDYYRTGKLSEAEKYFKTAINCFTDTDQQNLLAQAFYKLGMVYDDLGNTEDALLYYTSALNIFESTNDCYGAADVYNGIASVYYRKGDQDSTEILALKAMRNYEDCGNLETVSFMYMNLASLKNMQKSHKQALEYLFAGLEIADSLKLLSQLRQGYKNLSETYSYLGDFKKAYDAQLKYNIYKDSIFNKENAETFLELNTKYETEKKERQIFEKQAEIDLQAAKIEKSNQQKNLLILIAFLAAIVVVVVIFRFNEKRKYAKILDIKNQELEKLNSAKDKLFSIISHDLSSPVASYSRLTEALMNSVDKLTQVELKEYLQELNSSSKNIQSLLANLLQWSLQQSGHFTPNPQLLKLNEVCNSVIKTLSAVADEKEIRISFDCESEINIFADKKMIETALRNIISNAIKFSPKNSEVVFSTLIQSNWATIKITDSGPGLEEEEIKKLFIPGEDLTLIGGKNKNKGTGLGLILAGEFVRMNNGEIFAEQNLGKSGLTIIIKLKAS